MSDAIREAFEHWFDKEFDPEISLTMEDKQMCFEAWQAALQSQTAPAVPDGVDVTAFGSGDYTVEVGRYVDKHAVFIAPANPAGVPGELAQPTTGEDKHRLVPGERVMTFPTETQAFAVAEALAGRRINRLDGSSPTPQPDHSPDAGKVVQDFVNGQEPLEQDFAAIYNENTSTLYEYDSTATDAGKVVKVSPAGWIWDAYGSRHFTYGCHHKNVLEADGLTLIPVYPHPAQPRNVVQAEALDWFADWLKRQSFAHKKRWTSAANEALRCAARLRASQQEGG